MATSVKLNGLPELKKKLEGLTYDAQKKGGRFALRKAAQVVRDAAKQNAGTLDDPQSGRKIADNITERWASRYNKSTGNLMFRVGVAQGAKMDKDNKDQGAGGPTPHWRLIEFGTEKMAARPFFVRALSENAQRATDVFISQFSAALDRALRRAGK